MRYTLFALILLGFSAIAEGALRAPPEITSVEISRENVDVLYIRIAHMEIEAAKSSDGGNSFQAVSVDSIPPNVTTDLDRGLRRYYLFPREYPLLLRSDDDGKTWKRTGLGLFLNEAINHEINAEKEWHQEEYGHRLPQQTPLWHLLFGLFAAVHAVVITDALWKTGAIRALLKAAAGVVILFLVWCLLFVVHYLVHYWDRTQWPMAFWQSTAEVNPSAKTGIAMAIAAKPIPLLAYLLVLWPILPGSFDAILTLGGDRTLWRRQISYALVVTCTLAMVVFHLGMVFVGPLFE